MVFEEVPGEPFADVLAQRPFDEGQVLLKLRLAKGHAQEFAETLGDVIGKPVAVQHGDDVVGVGGEGGFGNAGKILGQPFALIGKDQAGGIKAIAAKHAAHGVVQEFGHRVGHQPRLKLGLGGLAAIAIGGVAGEGDFLQRHLGGQLVLQTIGVDEDAVVLFLQPLHLLRHALPMSAEPGVGARQRLIPMRGGEQREGGEIPGGFVGVPVGFCESYRSSNLLLRSDTDR